MADREQGANTRGLIYRIHHFFKIFVRNIQSEISRFSKFRERECFKQKFLIYGANYRMALKFMLSFHRFRCRSKSPFRAR